MFKRTAVEHIVVSVGPGLRVHLSGGSIGPAHPPPDPGPMAEFSLAVLCHHHWRLFRAPADWRIGDPFDFQGPGKKIHQPYRSESRKISHKILKGTRKFPRSDTGR